MLFVAMREHFFANGGHSENNGDGDSYNDQRCAHRNTNNGGLSKALKSATLSGEREDHRRSVPLF